MISREDLARIIRSHSDSAADLILDVLKKSEPKILHSTLVDGKEVIMWHTDDHALEFAEIWFTVDGEILDAEKSHELTEDGTLVNYSLDGVAAQYLKQIIEELKGER